MSQLRLVYAGTPEFADHILRDLDHHDRTPVAVFTQPDRPAGRGRKVIASPVKSRAQGLGIPVEQPTTFKAETAQQTLASYRPDILIVVAYGLILPPAILSTPKYGCLNVHASLLPRWRGAAPIERAYMAGDEMTGVSIMQMDPGLDTGPIYRKVPCPIGTASIAEVEANLADLGSQAVRETVAEFQSAHDKQQEPPQPVPQPEGGATYAHKLTAEDRILDFNHDASVLMRQVNALAQRMPVRISIEDKRIQLLEAGILEAEMITGEREHPLGSIIGLDKRGVIIQTATGQLLIKKLKFESGKGNALDGAALKNGYSHLFTTGATVH